MLVMGMVLSRSMKRLSIVLILMNCQMLELQESLFIALTVRPNQHNNYSCMHE